MKTKTGLLLGFAIASVVLVGIPFMPRVAAIGGVVPLLDCSISISPQTGSHSGTTVSDLDLKNGGLAIDFSGNIYVPMQLTKASPSSERDFEFVSLDRECNIRWRGESGTFGECGVGAQCRGISASTVVGDRIIIWQRDADSPVRSRANIVNTLGSLQNNISQVITEGDSDDCDRANCLVLSPQITTVPVRFDTRANGANNMTIFATGSSRVASFGYNMTGGDLNYNTATQATSGIWVAETAGVLLFTGGSGTDAVITKNSIVTGVQIGSSVHVTPIINNHAQIYESEATADSAFVLSGMGTADSTTVAYSRITSLAAGTLTLTVDRQVFTQSQINDGSNRDTDVNGWELDLSNRVLACGQYTGATEIRGFVAQYLTSNNTMHWNTTIDLTSDSDATRAFACVIDQTGGFWVVGQFDDAGNTGKVFARHYSGGDSFTKMTPRASPNLIEFTQPTPTFGAGTDAAEGLVNFAEQTGFSSAPSKFFFGLVLMSIAMVMSGAALRSFTTPRVSLIAVAIVAIGMMLFNAINEIWPAWTTVVLVIFAAGITMWFVQTGIGGRK